VFSEPVAGLEAPDAVSGLMLELGPDRLSFAVSRYDGPPEREITATFTPGS
jgi:hypothetical protein